MNTFETEELKKCADPVTGPAYFIKNYFYIQHPTKGSILLDPYDYQIELIDSYIENRFSINLIARQLGKTSTSAGYLLWSAMFKSYQNILVGGNKLATAKEILSRILYGYDHCPDFLKAKLTTRNKMTLEFDNSSRILTQAVSECFAHGWSISLLYLDEFAFVKNSSAAGAWASVRPQLSDTKTQVIINSSANHEDDFFATLWEDAIHNRNEFTPLDVDWKRHPDRDQAWADEMISVIGRDRFEIEYENRFAA